MDATPYSVGVNDDGADLDISLSLLNSSKQVIGTFNPATTLNAVIDQSLNAGTYYIVVNGTGNVNTSDYGSLGAYTLSGTFSSLTVTPIHDVSLNGKVENNKHSLNWNIIADEPVKELELETSSDGTNFSRLTNPAASSKNFTYDPFSTENIFYKLKVTSAVGQVAYSNVIKLHSTGLNQKNFIVSTLVHDDILVNAGENYQYQLTDISGKLISKGSNIAGISRINMNNAAAGIYVIQLFGKVNHQTFRIVKQ